MKKNLTWREAFQLLSMVRELQDNIFMAPPDKSMPDGDDLITVNHDIVTGYGDDGVLVLERKSDYYGERDNAERTSRRFTIGEIKSLFQHGESKTTKGETKSNKGSKAKAKA